jgi:hypothetical protein
MKCWNKGLPNKKISNYLLWGGRLAPPLLRAGETPTPQDCIIYLLEIPKHITLALIFPKRDRKLSAQFEYTIAVTEDGVEILTLREGES